MLVLIDSSSRAANGVGLTDCPRTIGHDVMDVALDGYGQLKWPASQGMEDLRRELDARFSRTRRKEAAEAVTRALAPSQNESRLRAASSYRAWAMRQASSGSRSRHRPALLVEAGLTPLRALQAATIEPARYLERDDVGRIGPGAVADLVLLDADPLADIHNITKIRGVVLDGRWLDHAALDALAAGANAAASSRAPRSSDRVSAPGRAY